MPPLSPVSAGSDWSREIYEAAKELFNGEARVMRPDGKPDSWDPITGETTPGTPDSVVQDWRPARAQHIRTPLEQSTGGGWSTERRFRFQMELRPDDVPLSKGLYVQFRGGKDHTLEQFAFQMMSAVNSSHAALRTLECSTEAGVVAQ